MGEAVRATTTKQNKKRKKINTHTHKKRGNLDLDDKKQKKMKKGREKKKKKKKKKEQKQRTLGLTEQNCSELVPSKTRRLLLNTDSDSRRHDTPVFSLFCADYS